MNFDFGQSLKLIRNDKLEGMKYLPMKVVSIDKMIAMNF